MTVGGERSPLLGGTKKNSRLEERGTRVSRFGVTMYMLSYDSQRCVPLLGEVAQGCEIAFDSETGDHCFADGRDVGVMAEGFPFVDIADMNLNRP